MEGSRTGVGSCLRIWVLFPFTAAASRLRSYWVLLLIVAASGVGLAIKARGCDPSRDLVDEPLGDCLFDDLRAALLIMSFASLLVLLRVNEGVAARRQKEMMPSWQDVPSVLQPAWDCGGSGVKGEYRGHAVTATAIDIPHITQYDGGTHMYAVCLKVAGGGVGWVVSRSRVLKPWAKPGWRLHIRDPEVAALLVGDGLLDVVRSAESCMSLSALPRITYDPETAELTLRDLSGTVPSATRFRSHLDLLVALGAVNDRGNPS